MDGPDAKRSKYGPSVDHVRAEKAYGRPNANSTSRQVPCPAYLGELEERFGVVDEEFQVEQVFRAAQAEIQTGGQVVHAILGTKIGDTTRNAVLRARVRV